jgi:hypothetical protein
MSDHIKFESRYLIMVWLRWQANTMRFRVDKRNDFREISVFTRECPNIGTVCVLPNKKYVKSQGSLCILPSFLMYRTWGLEFSPKCGNCLSEYTVSHRRWYSCTWQPEISVFRLWDLSLPNIVRCGIWSSGILRCLALFFRNVRIELIL